MPDVSWMVALAAGGISFLSPCILPLVPGYIGYISSGIDEVEGSEPNTRLMVIRSLFFVLGFSLIFIALGATASAMGQFLYQYVHHLNRIAGAFIVFFGLYLLGVIPLDQLGKTFRLPLPKSGGSLSAFLMGLAFAAGWTPCIGSVLAGILLYAGMSETMMQGVMLLGFYSLGLGIPFVLTAVFLKYFYGFISRFDRVLAGISKAGGFLLILLGLGIFFDKMTDITIWLQTIGI
ncbi:cytochrome c biogenesis CcdA family protein [Anoxynatronum sibiricum]|uniref:Cytochrome c biogenesis protein CcdA n=1 Tax=Anoxynatronum sibiricum TaxID=210623 RepID=A0ABU9VXJ3_9CLOT